MILFKHANQLSGYIAQRKKQGHSISFVPTMGALHHGHLTLLAAAREKADVTICSIFVNPTQFNNPDDFTRYPVTIEQDIHQLTQNRCDVLFLPSVDEIYPPGYEAPVYPLAHLEKVLEGKFRPGHFQGVCQVVDRLLQLVDTDYLLLGQKDFQQCQVIQRLLNFTGRDDISLSIVPTVREADGLAMSSRNLRLNSEQRVKAPAIFAALCKVKAELSFKSFLCIENDAVQALTEQGFLVDYFSIVNADTLEPATNDKQPLVALVAAYLGEIRLIDNLPLT